LVFREQNEPVGVGGVDPLPDVIVRAGRGLDVLDAAADSLRAKLGPDTIDL
jgi:hypothetical protein